MNFSDGEKYQLSSGDINNTLSKILVIFKMPIDDNDDIL